MALDQWTPLDDPLWQQAGLAPLEQAAMLAAQGAEDERLARMSRAWNAYRGVFPDPLTVERYEPRDLVKVNRMRRVVDISVHFLFGKPPTIALPRSEAAPETTTPLETWIADMLRANVWQQHLLDWAINGGVCGTGYLRLVPPAQDAAGHVLPGAYPTFHPLDPTNVVIHYDQHDITRILGYTIQYNGVGPDGKPAMFRQQIKPAGPCWVIADSWKPLNSTVWQTQSVTPWPLAWPPILHNKNLPSPNEVYGEADLTDNLIDLNLSRNFNLSNESRIHKHHGHPIVWLQKMAGRRLNSEPGTVIDLGEQGVLGQLNPPPYNEAGAQLGRTIDDAIYEESATPPITLGRAEDATPPSGVALRLKLWPMEQKTDTKRTLYGPALIELIRRMCELGGQGPDVLASLSWPEIVPMDPVATRQALVIDQELGVASKATIAGKLQYDWKQEQKNLKAEQALDPAPTVIQADAPANALQRAETAKPS